MKVYRFRVVIEDDNEIFRDIEVTANQTFKDFHIAIQKAFGFDGSQMASFYLSDKDWNKGEEVTLYNMNEEEDADKEEILVMNQTKLSALIKKVNQKVLYVFDFLNGWTFYIELIKIASQKVEIDYPVCVKSVGKAPDQYSKNITTKDEEDAILEALKDPYSFDEEDPLDEDITGEYDEYEQY
ncbi:MAG: plasmid pRiA4b ORF-3 family protein [Bacteroidota bacterium]